MCVCEREVDRDYGVAITSKLLKDIGLFCKRDQQKRLYILSVCEREADRDYGVAMICRLLQIIGLFCRI